MTPIVNAQKGLSPKVNRSLNLVDNPIQRKQRTNAQDRSFFIGLITLVYELAVEPIGLVPKLFQCTNLVLAVRDRPGRWPP